MQIKDKLSASILPNQSPPQSWHLGLFLVQSGLALQGKLGVYSKGPAKIYTHTCLVRGETFSSIQGYGLAWKYRKRSLNLDWLSVANLSWRLSCPFGQPLGIYFDSGAGEKYSDLLWIRDTTPTLIFFLSSVPSSFNMAVVPCCAMLCQDHCSWHWRWWCQLLRSLHSREGKWKIKTEFMF